MGKTTSMASIPEPPEALAARIGGDLQIGRWHLVNLCGQRRLQPDEDVLDIGCGVGRTAIALTSYLSDEGSYEGFDIDADSIAWCRREITTRYPDFRFTHVDVFNSQSNAGNPTGRLQPEHLVFPYPDERFDLVFLFSVFTHILTSGFENYCAEIQRVLRPGGRMLATFFLLSAASLAALQRSETPLAQRLLAQSGPCRTGFDEPELMVAYDERFVGEILARNGLTAAPPNYGTWIRMPDGIPKGRQDMLFAVRP
jgi:SAM-dependent methyltransferase